MIRQQGDSVSPDFSMASWEDDGGCVETGLLNRDLYSFIAQEPSSIMNAGAAGSSSTYEKNRGASLHTRQLINATLYPEHETHVFMQEGAEEIESFTEDFKDLMISVQNNENFLARIFTDVSIIQKEFQDCTSLNREDRARLGDVFALYHAKGF